MGKMKNVHRVSAAIWSLTSWRKSWKGIIKIAMIFDDKLYLEV